MEINFFLPKLKLLKSAVSDLFILCSFQGYLEGKKIGDRNLKKYIPPPPLHP